MDISHHRSRCRFGAGLVCACSHVATVFRAPSGMHPSRGSQSYWGAFGCVYALSVALAISVALWHVVICWRCCPLHAQSQHGMLYLCAVSSLQFRSPSGMLRFVCSIAMRPDLQAWHCCGALDDRPEMESANPTRLCASQWSRLQIRSQQGRREVLQ